MQQYVSVKKILELIPVSRSTLYRWMADLNFPRPRAKIGRRVFWGDSDIEEYVKDLQSKGE
jgi:predicted DNA-binding transcriptional regulator AlpA